MTPHHEIEVIAQQHALHARSETRRQIITDIRRPDGKAYRRMMREQDIDVIDRFIQGVEQPPPLFAMPLQRVAWCQRSIAQLDVVEIMESGGVQQAERRIAMQIKISPQSGADDADLPAPVV